MESQRQEHLAWCKTRALAYVDSGDLSQAVASMMSDLAKHEGTRESTHPALARLGIAAVITGDAEIVRKFITGFR